MVIRDCCLMSLVVCCSLCVVGCSLCVVCCLICGCDVLFVRWVVVSCLFFVDCVLLFVV